MTVVNMKVPPPVVTGFTTMTSKNKQDERARYQEKENMHNQAIDKFREYFNKNKKKKNNEVFKFIAGVGIAFLAMCGLKNIIKK